MKGFSGELFDRTECLERQKASERWPACFVHVCQPCVGRSRQRSPVGSSVRIDQSCVEHIVEGLSHDGESIAQIGVEERRNATTHQDNIVGNGQRLDGGAYIIQFGEYINYIETSEIETSVVYCVHVRQSTFWLWNFLNSWRELIRECDLSCC